MGSDCDGVPGVGHSRRERTTPESDLSGIVINTRKDVWTPIRPEHRLSRKPQWDTLQFRILPEALAGCRVGQHLGFGGADSQIWVAAIRVRGDK